MRIATRCLLGIVLLAVAWAGPANAQDDILAQIQKTATAPTIDGVTNDAVWAQATAHGLDEFYGTDTLEGPEDLDITWRALWDDANLYVMFDVTDDVIVMEESCNWEDDSVELYIDAQNLDVEEYNIAGGDDDVPVYQLTALAGFDADSVCAKVPYAEFENGDTSWFTQGINSYDDGGDETSTYYPQGTDVSQAVIHDDNHWSFEVAFPWSSLDETPSNIMARGSMGFGVAYNDDDDEAGRDTQPIWGDSGLDTLWHVASAIPSVALSTETVGGGNGTPGDFDGDGDLDAADIDALSAAVRSGGTDSKFDVSGDGAVTEADRGMWVDSLRKTYFGDSNLDGEFNSGDFVTVFTVGKYESGNAANWAEGDWNGDNQFNSSDFVTAFSAGGYEKGPRAAVSAGRTARSVAGCRVS